MATQLFYLLIFPGFLFLSAFGLFAEYADRKIYARMQNRIGPPWFQPLADFIKLLGKETIIPESADRRIFLLMPVFALTAAVTSFLYIPMWDTHALVSFNGDAIVVLYLLTIPTVTFFLGGWSSNSMYSTIGAVRSITQLFAYEVPLFMGILAPSLLAGTWSLSEISAFYNAHSWYWLVNLPGLAIALIAVQGKLEKVPFDIPEAETEIVGGTFTEYSGRLLALLRMALDVEMVVVASLLAAVFLPFGLGYAPITGFIIYLIKVFFIIFLMALVRTVLARLRIEQMVNFCWKYLAPAGLLQLVVCLFVKGVMLQ